jgi:hypothetical protein
LLAGFENDSDFIVTSRNPAKSVAGTEYITGTDYDKDGTSIAQPDDLD